MIKISIGLILFALAFIAEAGTLRIGKPEIDEDTVTVPVMLAGDVGEGVAALNFDFNYDPSALEPQAVNAGKTPQQLGKEVLTNIRKPGVYRVLMAGLNSSVLTSGEIVNIVFKRKGDSAETDISITG